MQYMVRACEIKIRNFVNNYNKENTMPLSVFNAFVRHCNLKDALISIAKVSRQIFINNPKFNYILPFALRRKNGTILTTMSKLADLTCYLINSGANDKNRSMISNNLMPNVIVLAEIVFLPLIKDRFNDDTKNPYNCWMMVYKDQMKIQYPIVPSLSRNYIMFAEIATDAEFNKCHNFSHTTLDQIFEANVGVSPLDYLLITFILFVYIYNSDVVFDLEHPEKYDWINVVSDFNKFSTVIKYLSIDYASFKEKFGSKNTINPLFLRPVIEFDDKRFSQYTIPCLSMFLSKVWDGMFYDIEVFYKQYQSKTGCRTHYRDYFGHIFEEYVGRLLQYSFNSDMIKPEIVYRKGQNRFFDWILEDKEKYYLIEVKSKEVSLEYIYDKSLEEYYKLRIIPELRKIKKKLQDIDKFDELKFLQGKTIYPMLVVKNVPMINHNLMIDLILKLIADDEELKQMVENREIFLFNIDEFELFIEGLKENTFNIEEIFNALKEDFGESLLGIMQKKYGNTQLRNSLLEETYHKIFKHLEPKEMQEKTN